MYIFRRPIYNNLLKFNNNNKRFFSLNIRNKLDVTDYKLNIINYIQGIFVRFFHYFVRNLYKSLLKLKTNYVVLLHFS